MRRLLSSLALATGLLVLGGPAALAGGPTSVLLANHETGRSAAALHGSAAYAELQAILGDENPPASNENPSAKSSPPGADGESGAVVRLVWLIHDVTPWRIDSVHVVGADVWVETYLDPSGADPWAASPVWHQPTRRADLVTTLTTLGVLGTGASDAGVPAASPGTGAPGAAADPASVPVRPGASWLLVTGVAAGGALVGAALALLFARRGPWLTRSSGSGGHVEATV